ncbi:plasmid partitioning protein RepB [Manganibacter manganicus]|uniref:Plasmid partitioning protein RepB n=1 Tax=Manganibacter manganicus TaxID=1873176 RepID=A0A1V8RS84_9HYPH|nr:MULTISPECIES: plasmid partitioning protein RepB [Phyllobacteriaceae]MBE0703763.1 plasmid partitioning protein RepB [Afipia sp.]MBN9245666.1 plasmid partitioning protein RepB [Mesorhizobium sp.]OQM76003.1 plasmid partitioning protein RepB [Pseudaminobacter manganicus]
MARKNVFDLAPEAAEAAPQPAQPKLGRPLLGLERPIRPASPLGSISQSLENINSRASRAEEIERQLAAGQTIIELDPALVDGSFVVDRLGVDAEDTTSLVAQIKEHGQQVPILVRPHPETEGRYQVAYGHRRLAAAKELGLRVRAVVRDLTDEQLVVSQGQENNSRTDLSFIERSFFGARLEDRGFPREIIMASLGVDKAALSRMIALIKRLPPELIEAVGPASSFGRLRWAELADMLDERGNRAKALKFVQEQGFLDQKSDARFQALYDLLKKASTKAERTVAEARSWAPADKSISVITKTRFKTLTVEFSNPDGKAFGAWVTSNLDSLYEAFRTSKQEN